jgi:putative dimethyl sulfoxide reductase chaperone
MDRSKARSLIYSILSLSYLYPDEEVYASIAAGGWIWSMGEAFCLLDDKNSDEYFRAIEQTIAGSNKGDQLTMAREYTRLFIGPFPHVIAPPYGSVYLENKGLFFSKTTSDVSRFYREAGFLPKDDLRDLPDHIANELEFMETLAEQESRASGGRRIRLEEIQMEFLSGYVLPWVPIFCRKVTEQSLLSFYRLLGSLTQEFIRFEQNYLGISEEMDVMSNSGSEP